MNFLKCESEEMAQWLGVGIALQENLVQLPEPHWAAFNCVQPQFLFWTLRAPAFTCVHAHNF